MVESKSGFQFDFEWRIALFTAILVPFMVSLGFWQLQRADEKSAMAAAFDARQNQLPAPITSLWDQPPGMLAYMPVQMSGRFLPDAYFLLDNQMRGGQVGYEVLDVLQLNSGGSVLVNRGWVAGGGDRQSLPSVPRIDGPVEITGHVYIAPGSPFLLAEQQLDGKWPMRIQAVEMEKLAPLVVALQGGKVFPWPVRINADARGALVTDWQIVNMSPVKHQAYAVQWFAMAAVLLVYYLMRSSNVWQLLRGTLRRSD
ncbi:MAG: SURF1 family protein [Halioglobus sp.]|nr:SURF1 family protein [Halioglobus sp.]